MDEHRAILLQDFIQHVRKFKFQIKEINKEKILHELGRPWGKAVYAFLGKDSFVQLLLVILTK